MLANFYTVDLFHKVRSKKAKLSLMMLMCYLTKLTWHSRHRHVIVFCLNLSNKKMYVLFNKA